jgi:acyl-CoA reductase-like NAD-dependent aldehyde dehydrogenase/nicotinamidase-related amidase
MQPALLLVDLQQDFLDRPGLQPSPRELAGSIAGLLAHARSSDMPIGHIRTRVDPTGRDRMPHWRSQDIWACVAGTPGEEAPPALAALQSEPVFHKQFFSGFADPGLDAWLARLGVTDLWIVGIYTHGCIRATALDAYERGYAITVVDDCIGSTDLLHAWITRLYLQARTIRFVSSAELLAAGPQADEHFNPDRPDQLVVSVRRSSIDAIENAVVSVCHTQPDWESRSLAERQAVISRFADLLAGAAPRLEQWMVRDLGKPRSDARDELLRASGHVATALQLTDRDTLDAAVEIEYQPHGTVALVTPWNNPVAIPVGKLAAALVLGNGIVWKPAFQADTISRHLLGLLQEAGLPAGLVELVNGGPREVASLAAHPRVRAVSLTGPEPAGLAVSAVCRPSGKPLQAELGGNNALLVLADAQLEDQAAAWVRMAFSFAGQRCTAIRRFVVEEAVLDRFELLFTRAMKGLQVIGPAESTCDVGPLLSREHLARVQCAVEDALSRGARLASGGVPIDGVPGHYYQPTLLAGLPPDDPLVQEELFGPVAVLQSAEGFEQGLGLVNGVRQGLVAGIATASPAHRAEFSRRVQAGIVLDGGVMRIHPAAPFGGRKASQIGPPEHGRWDREFFTRVRVVYHAE